MKLTRFEELEAWQEARLLTNKIYEMINHDGSFKKDLRLASQIQSAASSIMANISEGFSRRSDKEFVQFLFIAMSSAAEVKSHLYVALDQNYINQEQFAEIYQQCNKTGKLISGFIRYLRSSSIRPNRPDRPESKEV